MPKAERVAKATRSAIHLAARRARRRTPSSDGSVVGCAGVLGGVFDLFADFLHVLASTFHGVAGGQGAGGKQGQQQQGSQTLHGVILIVGRAGSARSLWNRIAA